MINKILLVVVTKIEARTILEIFSAATQTQWLRKKFNGKTYIYIGQLSGIDIYMIRSEMGTSGPGASQATISKAIQDLSPKAIILAGIAFGINPLTQEIGNVLVSKQIIAYEAAKIKEKVIPRGDRPSSSSDLLAMFRDGELDWHDTDVRFGLILSGEKLIADQEFRNWLLSVEPEAIGGEMEGVGLYTAAHEKKVDWIVVKGICDWADGNKNDDWHTLAAKNSTNFILHVIQKVGFGDVIQFSPLQDESFHNNIEPTELRKKLLAQIHEPFIYQIEKELIEHMDKYFSPSASDVKKSENYLAILYFSQEIQEIKRISKELRNLHSRKPDYLSDDLRQLVKDQINDAEEHTKITLELINAALSQSYHPLGKSIQSASRKVMGYIETVSVAIARNQIEQIWNSMLGLRLEMEIYQACLNEVNEYLQTMLNK